MCGFCKGQSDQVMHMSEVMQAVFCRIGAIIFTRNGGHLFVVRTEGGNQFFSLVQRREQNFTPVVVLSRTFFTFLRGDQFFYRSQRGDWKKLEMDCPR